MGGVNLGSILAKGLVWIKVEGWERAGIIGETLSN
jgi:hypothetical protein